MSGCDVSISVCKYLFSTCVYTLFSVYDRTFVVCSGSIFFLSFYFVVSLSAIENYFYFTGEVNFFSNLVKMVPFVFIDINQRSEGWIFKRSLMDTAL